MHSIAVRTRAEMEAEYGPIPPVTTTWTIHRSHASVTFVTDDGGDHWVKRGVVHAGERARRDTEALEMAAIQRNLK